MAFFRSPVNFGRVPAYSVYEEFVHPWDSAVTESPKVGGKWENYTYPLLSIQDSEWARSLSERLIGFPNSVHYRFVTLDQIVDVLCNRRPEVSWVNVVES